MMKKLRSMNLDPEVIMDLELEYEDEVWMLNMLSEDNLINEDDIMEYECTNNSTERCPPPPHHPPATPKLSSKFKGLELEYVNLKD